MFVGVVQWIGVDADDSDDSNDFDELEGREVECVLVKFLGEGAFSIVFGFAPRAKPHQRDFVVKFTKPDVRFEMTTVLHHSLKIAQELYPAHPLLMSSDERLQRLAVEMQQRIESPGVVFRVPAFCSLMDGTIDELTYHFLERYNVGTLTHDFYEERPDLGPSLDETLATRMEQLLDDDAIVEHARGFVEHCVDRIRAMAACRNGISLASNRLFKMLGLHLAGFINWQELIALTAPAQLSPPLDPAEVVAFASAAPMLHYLAQSKQGEGGRYEMVRDAAIAAARLLDASAVRFKPTLNSEAAYARNWEARTQMADGKPNVAVALHEAALAIATTLASLSERHDALVALAQLLSRSDLTRAQTLAAEAAAIRERLG